MKRVILEILLYVIVLLLAIVLSRVIYNAVMATDWPDWVKYLLLR